MTKNQIQGLIKTAGLKQYEVAEKLGLTEIVFSKKLRKGLSITT